MRRMAFWICASPLLALRVASAIDPLPQTMSTEAVRAEAERLEAEIKQLQNSPEAPDVWKRVIELQAQLNQFGVNRWNQENKLKQNILELARSSEYRAWDARIKAMSERANALHREDFARDKGINRVDFEARHAELAKLGPAETPELRALDFNVLSFPRMDGSTSTQPLAALIACRCFSASYRWVGRDNRPPRPWTPGLPWDESEWLRGFAPAEPEYELLEYMLRAVGSDENEKLAEIINRVLVVNASTHDAYVRIIESKSDIGLLARAPSPAELELARQKSTELDIAPCALDAFVFLVHRDNPVRGLTTAQLRGIYAGALTNWRQAGGNDEAIVSLRREEESGSEELMRTLVMTGAAFTPSSRYPRHLTEMGMGGVYLTLTSEPKGIGYSVYYYERYMSGSPRTQVIAVDGVEPTFETIRDRKYPHTCEVFVVTRKGLARDAPARKLRDWLRSPEGQAVVRESGYVPSTGVER